MTYKEKNIEMWFNILGEDVACEYNRLLKEVERLRSEKNIYPSQDNILASISSVNPQDIKAVIIGQDPYHEPGQAMGLAFSVPEGVKIPRSLANIFKELNSDLGFNIPESGNLTKWAENGVLLINTVLTVEEHKANSHKKLGWDKVTTPILRVCSELNQPIVFICWGRQAETLVRSVIGEKSKDKFILVSTHPSPLSASRSYDDIEAFMGSKPFSKTNKILKDNGIPPIDWNLD